MTMSRIQSKNHKYFLDIVDVLSNRGAKKSCKHKTENDAKSAFDEMKKTLRGFSDPRIFKKPK